MARETARSPLRELWDPVHGFEHWWSPLRAVVGSSSILHLRSDPPLVFAIYALLLLSLVLMSLGVWTGATSVAQLGPRRAALSLRLHVRQWRRSRDSCLPFPRHVLPMGEAYGVDAWRRRRARAAGWSLAHSPSPAHSRLAAPADDGPARPRLFPERLAQDRRRLADGTALYYALNLDHFYRLPAQTVVTWLQYVGVLPILSWLTRGGSCSSPSPFSEWPCAATRPIVAPAAGLPRGRGGASPPGSRWPAASSPRCSPVSWRWRRRSRSPPLPRSFSIDCCGARLPALLHVVLAWVLGKRVWLVVGVALHFGIDIGLNVGTFPQVMAAVYLAWLTGPEIHAFWRFVLRRAPAATIRHHPDEASLRQAALLRLREHATDRVRRRSGGGATIAPRGSLGGRRGTRRARGGAGPRPAVPGPLGGFTRSGAFP